MKIWKQREFDKEEEERLISNGKGKLLARLLVQREVTVETVDKFLDTDYKSLRSPFDLHDMEKAVKIFHEVVKANGKVVVSADYDCDGITSSLMIRELCDTVGISCKVFLPSRMEHGYGLNPKTISALKNMMGEELPDLLFVLDCGMNNSDQIDILKNDIGVKNVIVIDHHLGAGSGVSTNADALVTWHLSEGHEEMCACGEVFQFIRGVKKVLPKVNPIEFITYAAMGTIADISPIVGNNRIIVKNGLTSYAINHVPTAGLMALMRKARILVPSLTQEDISFRIAPKINAVGRMHHPDLALGLLSEKDPTTSDKIAEHVMSYNDQRKKLQKKIEKEADGYVNDSNPESGILVYDEEWHIGVVGIVASRLTETFNKPAIVIGKHNGNWKGSGRSVPGVNVKEILDMCSEMFTNYGGHAAAVGMTIKPEYIEKAPKLFDEACKKYYSKHKIDLDSTMFFDACLGTKAINIETAQSLRKHLYPYCKDNNPEPVFMIQDVVIYNIEVKAGDGWRIVKFQIQKDDVQIEYPFKIFSDYYGEALEGKQVDLFFSFPQMYEIKPNRWSEFELSAIDIIEK